MKTLQTITKKARENRTNRAQAHVTNLELRFDIEYREYAEGFNGQYAENTFYVYNEGVQIGDLYDNHDGTFAMWVDELGVLVEGLTQPIHIERAWQDGTL